MAEEKKEQQNPPMFDIIRLYSKDVSFETPNLPEVFKEEWKPETSIDLHVNINDKIDEANNVIEVALRITVTTKLGEKVAYLCEATQAGLFHIENVDEGQKSHMLHSLCPSILFPYVRETISSLVNKASFPQFNLAPVNFDMLYLQKLREASAAQPEAAKVE